MSTIRELKKERKLLKTCRGRYRDDNGKSFIRGPVTSLNIEELTEKIKQLQKLRLLKLLSQGKYGRLEIKNRNKYLFGGLANGSK